MPLNIIGLYVEHIKENPKIYVFLAILFTLGLLAGFFVVNGLVLQEKVELQNYVQSFMKIFSIKKLDNWQLFKVSLLRESKTTLFLWAIGVSIIGIPFILLSIVLRGFGTGFSIAAMLAFAGKGGLLFVASFLVFKEFLILPVLLSISANGIVFSKDIIKCFSRTRVKFDSLKVKFLKYCVFALIQYVVLILAVLMESVILPTFVKKI